MIDDPAHGWNRRDLLQGAALLALALGVPVAAVTLSGLRAKICRAIASGR